MNEYAAQFVIADLPRPVSPLGKLRATVPQEPTDALPLFAGPERQMKLEGQPMTREDEIEIIRRLASGDPDEIARDAAERVIRRRGYAFTLDDVVTPIGLCLDINRDLFSLSDLNRIASMDVGSEAPVGACTLRRIA